MYKPSESISRRQFVKRTGAAALAASYAAASAPAILGANNTTYRTALIGSGWWGMNIMRAALESGRCKATAVCDVDGSHLDDAAEEIEELTGDQPKKFRDYRDLLDEEPPDIAIVATPDHWHALPTIAAIEAGAHVYVEKPIGHTIGEGRAMVNAARANDRIVQVGTHRRVSPHNMSAMEFLREGNAGDVGMVRAFVHYGGGPESPRSNEEPPDHLDWDFWCGPAPLRPFNPAIHPRGFRHFLDYANGQLGDWGIHWMDQILWWAEEKHPKRVSSVGGRVIRGEPVYTMEEQTTDGPDHQVTTFEFENFTATWEHRMFAANHAENHNVGVYFYGTEGTLHLGWTDGWTFYPADGSDSTHVEPELHTDDNHNIPESWDDFIDAIENDRLPASDIELSHYSTNLSLLGMLSLKLGREIQWDGEREEVIDDPEANTHLRRPYRGEWEYPEVS